MTANFSMSFAFYLLTPLLPLYLSEDFNASKDVIGLVLSGYTLTALLVRPFSGFVVDSFPRKKVLLVSLFLYFLFFGTYLLASSLLLFALVRTLHGAPFGQFSQIIRHPVAEFKIRFPCPAAVHQKNSRMCVSMQKHACQDSLL